MIPTWLIRLNILHIAFLGLELRLTLENCRRVCSHLIVLSTFHIAF